MTLNSGQVQADKTGLPVLRWWWVALAGCVTILITLASLFFLLRYTQGLGSADQARASLDAIQTALSVTVGTGGAFALWLAARKQRSTEIQLTENARIADDSKRHLERVAKSNELDTEERRVTDLYAKAVEQLGSDKAPVRLGGLYALERLARDNVNHAQTVISMFCAYLRMPFYLPDGIEVNDYRSVSYESLKGKSRDDLQSYEELQVRLTVQRLLASFLRKSEKHPERTCNCAVVYDIDLRGALLIAPEFENCHFGAADFTHARFVSTPHFHKSIFRDEVWFYEVSFDRVVNLNRVTFLDRAIFTRCNFPGLLWMQQVKFCEEAFFWGSIFGSEAKFSEAHFGAGANFSECKPTIEYLAILSKIGETWSSSGFNFEDATGTTEGSQEFELPPGWQMQGGSKGKIVRTAEVERVIPSVDAETPAPQENHAKGVATPVATAEGS